MSKHQNLPNQSANANGQGVMRIRYASDLHIEFDRAGAPDYLPSIGEDVVVLAGDIGVGTEGIRWAEKCYEGRPVLYVLGNHEYYGAVWDTVIPEARQAAVATENVQLLENDAVTIKGVRFLGCTLWTDFNAGDDPARAMFMARKFMTDYRAVYTSKKPLRFLRPEHVQARCLASREWLAGKLAASDEPTVVVTHMAPSADERLVNPEFLGDPLNPAFHNAFDELIGPPALAWIFGHHHYSFSEKLKGVRIVSNQRGYPNEDCDFSWDRLLDVNPEVPEKVDPRQREERLHRLCMRAILIGDKPSDDFEGEVFRMAAHAIKQYYPAAAQRLLDAMGPQPEADEILRERVLSAVVDCVRLRERLLRRLNDATASHLYPPDRP